MTDAELEEREVAAELFELRRRVVLDRQDPDQVADDYERSLLETPAPSFAHWEALRRMRDSLHREREDERSRLLLRELTRLTRSNHSAALVAASGAVVAALASVVALALALASLLAPA